MGGYDLEKACGRIIVIDGAVDEGLGAALDRGQGGSQLVRDVGDEILAHGLQAALAGDVVENGHRTPAGPLGNDRRHPDVDVALFAAELDFEGRPPSRVRGLGDRFLDPGIAYQLDQGHAGTPALEPEHTRQGRIGEGDAIVRVGYQDPFRDAV